MKKRKVSSKGKEKEESTPNNNNNNNTLSPPSSINTPTISPSKKGRRHKVQHDSKLASSIQDLIATIFSTQTLHATLSKLGIDSKAFKDVDVRYGYSVLQDISKELAKPKALMATIRKLSMLYYNTIARSNSKSITFEEPPLLLNSDLIELEYKRLTTLKELQKVFHIIEKHKNQVENPETMNLFDYYYEDLGIQITPLDEDNDKIWKVLENYAKNSAPYQVKLLDVFAVGKETKWENKDTLAIDQSLPSPLPSNDLNSDITPTTTITTTTTTPHQTSTEINSNSNNHNSNNHNNHHDNNGIDNNNNNITNNNNNNNKSTDTITTITTNTTNTKATVNNEMHAVNGGFFGLFRRLISNVFVKPIEIDKEEKHQSEKKEKDYDQVAPSSSSTPTSNIKPLDKENIVMKDIPEIKLEDTSNITTNIANENEAHNDSQAPPTLLLWYGFPITSLTNLETDGLKLPTFPISQFIPPCLLLSDSAGKAINDSEAFTRSTTSSFGYFILIEADVSSVKSVSSSYEATQLLKTGDYPVIVKSGKFQPDPSDITKFHQNGSSSTVIIPQGPMIDVIATTSSTMKSKNTLHEDYNEYYITNPSLCKVRFIVKISYA